MFAERSHYPTLGFREYQGALTRSVYPIRLDLEGSAELFEARLSLANVGPIEMVRAHAGSGFHCMQQPGRRQPEGSTVILKMQLEGRCSYQHVGRKLDCNIGDIAIFCDNEEIAGEQHGEADALVVKIPLNRVSPSASAILSAVGQVLTVAGPSGRLLGVTLKELWSMAADRGFKPRESLIDSLVHLIDASIDEKSMDQKIASIGRLDARYVRLRELIERRCTDPDVTAGSLARELAMSRSSMYEAARAAGSGVERMIIEARVKKAITVLSDPAHANTSITALAYDLGFKHPSHLSRVFLAHAGVTPQQFRRKSLVISAEKQLCRH